MTGEIYFKVEHDAGRPFIIHTTDMDIKVLGTEVDVRAYKDENYSQTSLIKGAVAVTVNRDKQQQIYLKPRQKIVVQNMSLKVEDVHHGTGKNMTQPSADTIASEVLLEPIKVMDGNLIPETAWKENTLLFEDEPLESLAKRLERWYDIKIIITDSTLARQRFTGRADNVSLDKLLHILQIIKPFNYTMHNKELIIK